MKVLYIGHYRENSGWGQSAIDYILALDAAGVDVVCRPVVLGLAKPAKDLPERIRQLEAKNVRGCDVCIQHVLPHYMDYNGSFGLNVGLYFTETSSFRSSGWPVRLNTMDLLFVPNSDAKQAAIHSDVFTNIEIVGLPSDVTKFQQKYKSLDIEPIRDTYSFYFVGEFDKRKNLAALIKAFHTEFHTDEPVSLVIKTGKGGQPPKEVFNGIAEICNKIKLGLKKYPNISDYKSEVIISNRMSEEELMRLHNTCDCFVMPSYGEAWCVPAFDAMGFGRQLIVSKNGGPKDFIPTTNCLIDGKYEPCFAHTDTFGDLFTANEDWFVADQKDLMKIMRYMYEMPDYEKESLRAKHMEAVYKYSYESIGGRMKAILEAYLERKHAKDTQESNTVLLS